MIPINPSSFNYQNAKVEYEKLGKFASFATQAVAIIVGIFSLSFLYEKAFTYMVQKFIDPDSKAGQTAAKVSALVNANSSSVPAIDQLSPFIVHCNPLEAAKILEKMPEGSFMVRPQAKDEFIISSKEALNNSFYTNHLRLKVTPDNKFVLIDNFGKERGERYALFKDLIAANHLKDLASPEERARMKFALVFHDVTMKESEKLLSNEKVGSYLVRPSREPGQYTLAYRKPDEKGEPLIQYVRFRINEEGEFVFPGKYGENVFTNNIEEVFKLYDFINPDLPVKINFAKGATQS